MSKKETSTKVIVAEKSDALAQFGQELTDIAITDDSESWGVEKDLVGNEEIFFNDLLIPKLWLMQGSSDMVKSRDHDHQAGDWTNSLTGEILGDPDTELKFVVLSMNKRWQAFFLEPDGKGGVDKVYTKDYSAPVTLQNMNWKYSEVVDGKDLIRRQVLSFVVILERDILAKNPQPYALDFASTSKKGGRILYNDIKTFISKIHDLGGKPARLPCAAALYSLGTSEVTFDKGSAWVKNVKPLGYSSVDAVVLAREVYKFIAANDAVETHEEYEVVETVTATSVNVSKQVENGSEII